MLRYLLTSSAALALAAPALAETISTKVTTPLMTSTVKAGAPDSIVISAQGSVVPTGGTAITVDSNHSVTNQGAITISNASNSAGIVAVAGTTGDIVNSGTITIDEPYTPTDTDKDGDLDGPFALGSGRFAIRTDGAHTGKIVNSGTIAVEGNDSAGIWLGGPLTGSFTHEGKTTVLGDHSVGVRTDAVSGKVRLAGTVDVKGEGATGARFTGDVGGAMEVQGTIVSTGYRTTTVPSNTSKLDADDLLQGGSALVIEGNVAGGIILAVPPKDNNPGNPDEDGDGIEDAKEGTARVTTYGAAPAMVIGATDRNIQIGSVAGTASQHGLQIEGAVLGSGLYAGVDGNGLVVGGRGGDVTIARGVSIAGSVTAISNGASATAMRFGAGASTPLLHVSGTVEAKGGNSTGAYSTAVQIDAGANLPALHNSGTIKAAAAGANGHAAAVVDKSGTLTLVSNSGSITASGPTSASGRLVAIDLSSNTTGATVRQTEVGAGFTAPSITGDIRFGTGDDLLDLADGTMKGDVRFGAGTNRMALSGDAVYVGNAVFGAGDDTLSLAGTSAMRANVDFGGGNGLMTLSGTSTFAGRLTNAGMLAVDVAGGTLALRGANAIGSLSVGANGTLLVTLDKTAGAGTFYDIAGTANFASGATLALTLTDTKTAEGRYTILQAGSLQGVAGIKAKTDAIPYMFKATVAGNSSANTLAIDVARRTTQELELNRSQAGAYNALFAAIGEDEEIEKVFLGITEGDVFRNSVRQMLPDHAGGAFESISLGNRALAAQVSEPQSPVYAVGGLDILLTAAGWTTDKEEGATAAYDLGGFGFGASGEIDTAVGSFGTSLNWYWNDYTNGGEQNRVLSDTYELAAYWRGKWGGLAAFARGSVGMADFRGRRTFTGQAGNKAIQRNVISEWNGTVMSASGGLSYEGGGRHFFFRPAVSFDYLKLDEDGYTDKDGGGLNLIVEDRKSDEFAVNGGMALGVDFSGTGRGDREWFRIEGEGGWREIVGGALGQTTAKFEGGTAFTLDPEQIESGWYARLRAKGGSEAFEVGGEVGAEDRHGGTAFTLRGTVRLGF